jgi:hypothetical protein
MGSPPNMVDMPRYLKNPKNGRIDDEEAGIEQDLHQKMAFEDDRCPVRSWQVPATAILEIFRSNGNDVGHTTFYLISDLYRALSDEKLWYFAQSLSSGRRDERS